MRLLVLVLTFVSGFVTAASAQQSPAPTVGITYDDFIRWPPEMRRERFLVFSAEQKALMIRTHAERWLTANRATLSDTQIAVASEAIRFVTPRIYLQPADPDILEQTQRITQKLTCILGVDNVRRAFTFDASRTPAGRSTWQSTFAEWLSWFSDCVL